MLPGCFFVKRGHISSWLSWLRLMAKFSHTPNGAQYIPKLCEVVQCLHGMDSVHGDVRPPNIMVVDTQPGTVQLIDFDWAGKPGEVSIFQM